MRLLIIFLLFACTANAQRRRIPLPQDDSLSYYYQKLAEMRRVTMDSLYNSEAYRHAQEQVERLKKTSKRSGNQYMAMTFTGEYCNTRYDGFNADNAQAGFGALPRGLGRVGFGLSFAEGRKVFEFYYGMLGFGNRVSKGDDRINANLSNLLQMEWGYCLVQKGYFRVYPYAGLSLRFSTISYRSPYITTGNNDNITAMMQGNSSITLQSTKPGYQAGLGVEFPLVSAKKDFALLLFVKGGTNSAFTRETYRYRDVIKYQPGIRQGDWLVSFGVKIGGG